MHAALARVKLHGELGSDVVVVAVTVVLWGASTEATVAAAADRVGREVMVGGVGGAPRAPAATGASREADAGACGAGGVGRP